MNDLIDLAGSYCCVTLVQRCIEHNRPDMARVIIARAIALITEARSLGVIEEKNVRRHLANKRFGLAAATVALAKKRRRKA